jgi:phospholipid-binding lipoprotein MlaA
MLGDKYARSVLGIFIVLSTAGCVTLPPDHQKVPQDPWESWNRGVYRVNDALDRAVAKPVAKTYVKVVPSPLRTGVSNFLTNLNTPTVMLNDALQGKLLAAANDLGRFVLNSTVGIGGLLDPASSAGLQKNDEDFGQTLGVWGLKPGPFLELPLLGPSDLRDAPAKVVDAYTNPRQYIHNNAVKYSIWGVDLVDRRAALLSLDDTLKRVYDPYAFIRDAYLQRRAYLVSDGKVTDDEPLVDPGADDAPAAASPSAPPVLAPDRPAPAPPP